MKNAKHNNKNNVIIIFQLLRRLFIFAIFFVFVVVLTLMGMGYICRAGRLGTTYKKHARLEAVSSPKMVLIGGSNLHYGVNSKILQDSIGMPVVNMGIQQSIGLKYMFDEVKESLKEGDILLIAIEFPSYIDAPLEGRTNLTRIVSIYPFEIKHLNAKQYYQMMVYSGVAMKQHFRDIQNIIARKLQGTPSFNDYCDEFGDYHGHKGKSSVYIPKPNTRSAAPDSNGFTALLDVIRKEAEQKKVHILVGFSPCAEVIADKAFFDKLEALIPEDIKVGQMSDYRFPNDFFFDTPSHLSYDKREMRTQMLISDLKKYSKQTENPFLVKKSK